ncbi:polysaccharide pyruvyl transferase WcaK-like protein [Rhodoplanes tepidamans]|uniref:Polysaccharide pyruvyl transferase family protein n=2 Tax=Rhodoplanes TaxID=29407 RepID=A0ABT5J6L6_RHOTP|nr:polysaccharide pyruvyl transferase family protein [Rhodoplanes tepidamans]MDC7785243.1 polysaccharide pyruvyl transferase family protein [Rhodoplanes tepidamans]MDQ0353501.1 polysaccharide pyruvyl transferase WcaK-like protein [Rhodoplanes tepidamans]
MFNVAYSPNLGDGVIADCLSHALRTSFAGAIVTSVDLAGRTERGAAGPAARRLAQLALLQRMPRPVKDLVVALSLGPRVVRTLRPAWRRALDGADVAIIGGGQLFQDGDLNFPLKLTGAAAECRRLGVPIAVFGVGAAPSRSPVGRALFRRLLRMPEIVHIAARDPQSQAELGRLGGENVQLCRDPALLAAEVWPAPPRRPRTRPRVGVGVTHGALLRHHSDGGTVSPEETTDRYARVVASLVEHGFDVVCFSNGAAEDAEALAAVGEAICRSDAAEHAVTAPRRETPGELATLISGLDAVVSHRLHACILAYAYRIPHIGFAWDPKVRHFFDLVERPAYCVPFDRDAPKTIAPRVVAALTEGIAADAHARVLAETRTGLRALRRAISDAMEAGSRRRMAAIGETEGASLCP